MDESKTSENDENKDTNIIDFSVIDFGRREIVIDLEKQNIIRINRQDKDISE